jgi:2',3'-cyclic-nucleotide 2'-phosphodiesterase (5'-nucleotidase family)
MPDPTTAPRRLAHLGVAVIVLLTGTAGSCSQGRHETTPERAEHVQAPALPRPDLRLLLVTDLQGYLEPCGCTSRPLGGIDRMAARAAAVRADGVPTLMLAAGDLFFHGAPEGADLERGATQERWRAETLTDILARLELAAAAPGPLDFGYGTETFEQLAERAPFALLAAGVQLRPEPREGATPAEGPSDPPLVASALRRVGSIQVGIVGLTDLHGRDGSLPERVEQTAELREAGRAEARSLRERGAQIVIALVNADRRTARRLAASLRDVDFVVEGGLDEAEPKPPASTGGAVLLHAARQGHGLTVVDLWRRGDGEWTDASVWTREAEREHHEARIDALRRQIADWERDETTDRADLDRQRARLAALEREAAALVRPPSTEGNVLAARFEELAPDAPRAEAVSAIVDRYDARVNEHNERAFADWAPEAVAEGQPHYVGSQTCASCHGAAVRWWRTTPHGRAYATLERQNKNFNLSCVGCHVTGYLRPGGSTVTHVDRLKDVGCESCHGPGSMHVSDPAGAAVNVQRAPEETTCRGCHTPEHSDRFDFETYRRLLIAPGHGAPQGHGPAAN